MTNPLLSDELVAFLLEDVLDLDAVLALPAFADHSKETCRLYLDAARKVARERMYPFYEVMDREGPRFEGGKVYLHPRARPIYEDLVNLGVIAATRPPEVGGAGLPLTVASFAQAYLMAANLGLSALAGLSTGAARLIESFGDEALKARFLARMYAGEWAGTMALTEPQAGSSLSDVSTKAIDAGDGRYRVRGTKVFISGGEQDLTENIVHLTLARLEGAPAGIKGVSLFAIPKLREEGGALVDNDVVCMSVFHKLGWRSLPSVQLSFGDRDDCYGWLVGAPHRGITQMFQMMNEARLMVGLNAVASASVAYQQALIYSMERTQGRPITAKDPSTPQVPIIEHADVRRMLLRQKAIVEGGLGLVAKTAVLTDLSEHAEDPAARADAKALLDLLIPVAKTFPAEAGFEANTLAIQIHGGYGYTSEYLPESWWRDQKLNSLHEGTSGIQALDLLGRKAVAQGGQVLARFVGLVQAELEGAEGLDTTALEAAVTGLVETTMSVAARALSGDVEGFLRHAADYMDAFSKIAIGWTLLGQAKVARQGLGSGRRRDAFYRGVLASYAYWAHTEIVAVPAILERIRSGETSYASMAVDEF